MINKIIIICFVSTLGFSSGYKNDLENKPLDFISDTEMSDLENKEYKKFIRTFTLSKVLKSELLSSMEDDLYISNIEKRNIISENFSDENYKKALYFYYKKRIVRNFKQSKVNLPDYISMLKELKKSTEKGNLLASYTGFMILSKFFLLNGNIVGKEYLRDITKPMADNNYVLGLFWYGRSYMKEWSRNNKANYGKSIKYFEIALEEIKELKNNNDKYKNDSNLNTFEIIISKYRAKSSGMIYIKKEREQGRSVYIKRVVHGITPGTKPIKKVKKIKVEEKDPYAEI